MKISQLITMLHAILREHGDILVRCGEHRIGAITLIHSTTAGSPPVAVITPRLPPPRLVSG